MKVVSFDVFDTVLTRKIGNPRSLHMILGKQVQGILTTPCSVEKFAYLRTAAESIAYEKMGQSTTLSDIYMELERSMGLTQYEREKIMKMERELEEKLIIPIPIAKCLVEKARKNRQQIVYVSDMYLDSDFIRAQHERFGLWRAGDKLFVSCEYGKSKSQGLFKEIVRILNIKASDIKHYGNDEFHDYKAAKVAGLKRTLLNNGNLNRYERILEAFSSTTQGLASIMAGVSRQARISVPASSKKQELIRDVAASVAAPLLVSYVLWVLQYAKINQLRRLYFLARDGHILLKIAAILIRKLNLSIELKYLYGSRQAWYLPSLEVLDEKELEVIFAPSSIMTIKDLFARFKITPKDITNHLKHIGFNRADWERKLTNDEYRSLRKLILEEKEIKQLILEHAKDCRKLLLGYLAQEGLYDATPYAIVDLGWRGGMQKALSRAANIRPVGLYYGIIAEKPLDEKYGTAKCYLFDNGTKQGFLNYADKDLNIMLETLCSADHGVSMGYEKKGSVIVPVLKENRNTEVVDWGLPLIQQTICQFSENMELDSDLVNPWVDMRQACSALIDNFWLKPGKIIAKAWGDFPFEEDQCSGKYHSLASSYGMGNIISAFNKVKLPQHLFCSWRGGSMAITPVPLQILLTMAVALGKRWRAMKLNIIQIIKRVLNFK
ncbi:MAG: hypothetical protein PHN49_02405 [Candidatus Omnitrophica bacterium]|nr:hypothetical protein [Candidatus Omnitrophota bacterium]MDD5670471.1 hypothetical protein [Candidatus Omnitrophota bacterium]